MQRIFEDTVSPPDVGYWQFGYYWSEHIPAKFS